MRKVHRQVDVAGCGGDARVVSDLGQCNNGRGGQVGFAVGNGNLEHFSQD